MNYVVGVAVAGRGLENLKLLFSDLTPDMNMAFIVVAPIPRDRESKITEILQRVCWLPVHKVDQPMEILPGNIYVIAENTLLTISDNILVPEIRQTDTRINNAIDTLLTSLANNYKDKAIGIILDGIGTAGLSGVNKIEKNGGYIIINEPSVGRDGEMPRGIIEKDAPDIVLPIAEIVPHLLDIINQTS